MLKVITVDERRRVKLPAKQGDAFKFSLREDGAIILTPVVWIPKSQITPGGAYHISRQ